MEVGSLVSDSGLVQNTALLGYNCQMHRPARRTNRLAPAGGTRGRTRHTVRLTTLRGRLAALVTRIPQHLEPVFMFLAVEQLRRTVARPLRPFAPLEAAMVQ